jgi:D-alanyl-D-alanine carboxypeptidase (penicillin-binding protein 5/6)
MTPQKQAALLAAELGMAHSVFRTVHGLPPAKGQQPDETTARDMARLGQFCVLDPAILEWTSQKELKFRPESALETNTNKLLWQLDGSEKAGGIKCDGIKTGYTRGAGFCLTATAVKDGIRLIAVVMGADDKKDRFAMTRKLLEDGFAKVAKKQVVKKGQPIGNPVRVANCETAHTQLVAADDFSVVITKEDADKLVVAPQLPEWIQPPVKAGAQLGEATVQLGDKALAHIPAVAPKDLAEAGWRWKLLQSIVPATKN